MKRFQIWLATRDKFPSGEHGLDLYIQTHVHTYVFIGGSSTIFLFVNFFLKVVSN